MNVSKRLHEETCVRLSRKKRGFSSASNVRNTRGTVVKVRRYFLFSLFFFFCRSVWPRRVVNNYYCVRETETATVIICSFYYFLCFSKTYSPSTNAWTDRIDGRINCTNRVDAGAHLTERLRTSDSVTRVLSSAPTNIFSFAVSSTIRNE